MYFSGKLYAKKLTAWKYLAMLKMSLAFVFLAQKGWFFNMSIYGLLLVNWHDQHDQTHPGQQNPKKQHFKVWKLLLNNWACLYLTG